MGLPRITSPAGDWANVPLRVKMMKMMRSE